MARKVLIIGFGSIAKKHIKALKSIDPAIEIIVVRQQHHDANLGEYQVMVNEVLFDLDEAFKRQPHAALITNPAPKHLSAAKACLMHHIPVFIEKPLADTAQEIHEFLEFANKQMLPVVVGYCLHYFKSLVTMNDVINNGRIGRILSINASVGQWLPNWRPGTDYRQNVTARRELGGGVMLELSHEIDYLRWFLGKPLAVTAVSKHISNLEIDVEDIAEITIEFEGGALGHVHMDFLDQAFERSCRIVGEQGTLLWEAHEGHRVKLYNVQEKKWEEIVRAEDVDLTQMYVEQMRSFLSCVEGNSKPKVTLEDGMTTLNIILAAKESAIQGRRVNL